MRGASHLRPEVIGALPVGAKCPVNLGEHQYTPIPGNSPPDAPRRSECGVLPLPDTIRAN